MSAWNGVLQALHSSLIDELNEKYPDEKPELGLPSRAAGWALSSKSESALLLRVTVDGASGLVALGALSNQKEADLKKLLQNVVKHAAPDFTRRGIAPQFEAQFVFSGDGKLPKGVPAPGMVIWLPISLSMKKDRFVFDLGVGV